MTHLMKFLTKVRLPLLLFCILIFPLFLGPYISPFIKSILYSISLSMKAILLFILPFIIFSFIFYSLMNFKTGVLKFVFALIIMIFISNSAAIFTGFTVGSLTLPKLSMPTYIPAHPDTALAALWNLELPKLIPNQIALLIGFCVGLFFSFKRNKLAERTAKSLHRAATFFLKKIFTPLLPLFILGFVFKLEHDNILETALQTYRPVALIVIGTQLSYIIFLYLLVSKFSLQKFWGYIKNVLPATITGLSTLSSAATMPILILCTEKNLKDPEVAEIVIPATINTHTLGSALGVTILTLTTLLAFGKPLPDLAGFLEFGFFYALAKFAVAAVPGGAIIVVTPLLETYFHFSSEMIGLITAIYMLFDPFGTATNVTGNGFFTIAFSKLFKFNFNHDNDSNDVTTTP